MVRRMPLRWAVDDGGLMAQSAVDRGWFWGARECARVLANEAGMEVTRGRGFGGTWPLLEGEEGFLAPAMPAAIGTQRECGSDAEYRRDGDSFWREAVGAEDLFLTTNGSQPSPGYPFDLLWFGESERFIVRAGFLEISDLFGELRLPADQNLLERLLVRGRRLHPDVLSSLAWPDREGPQTIEVRRPSIVSTSAKATDPVIFLAARIDVEHLQEVGDQIVVRTVDGEESSFKAREHATGWRLTLQSGNYVFTDIRLERTESTLSLRASLASNIDGMALGMRGRLVFDLRSDLVALG